MQYEIKGTPFPVAICTLNAGETLITERGSMSWMSSGMQMQTVGGSVGKALGRMFSGEALFQNKYTASSTGDYIAFAFCWYFSCTGDDVINSTAYSFRVCRDVKHGRC